LDIPAAFFVAAGAQCSQSPMTAGEARGDMEDIVTLRRITRWVATYLSGLDRAGLQSDSGVAIYT